MTWKSAATFALAFFAIPQLLVAQGFLPAVLSAVAPPAEVEAPGTKADSPATVIVRTYNNYGVPADDVRRARVQVDDILNRAGIAVSWLDCWYRDKEPADAPRQCRQPLAANELTLRLHVGNSVHTGRFVSLGFSLVNVPDRPPFLATVFVDLVRSMSKQVNVDFGVLLGRAIAHELGHLLLNSNRHNESGLMRAGWTRAELRRNDPKNWIFEQNEIATIQIAAAHRNGEATAFIGD